MLLFNQRQVNQKYGRIADQDSCLSFQNKKRNEFYEELLNKTDYEPRGKEIFGSWKLY